MTCEPNTRLCSGHKTDIGEQQLHTVENKFVHKNPTTLFPHEALPTEVFMEFVKNLSSNDAIAYANSLFNNETANREKGENAPINLFKEHLRGVYELTPRLFAEYKNTFDQLGDIDPPISNATFLSLFKNLKTFKLNYKLVTPEIFEVLQNIPTLRNLDLSYCNQIQDWSFLQYLPNLIHLDLSRCDQIKLCSFLQHTPNLTHLNLCDCWQIEDYPLLQHKPKLTHLNLSFCDQIDDWSFLQHLPNLIHLDLSYCTQIDDWSIFDAYPHIQITGSPSR